MRMKLFAAAIAAGLAVSSAASATTTVYNIEWDGVHSGGTGGGYTGYNGYKESIVGALTVTDNIATSFTGTETGLNGGCFGTGTCAVQTVSLTLAPVGTVVNGVTSDNVFTHVGVGADANGIAFVAPNGDKVLVQATANYASLLNNGANTSGLGGTIQPFRDPVAFAIGVPEPATWAMMILGVLGLGAVLRRRGENALAAA